MSDEVPPSVAKDLHPWSKEALLAKAQRFAEEMLRYPRDDWRFGLWSTFALESLGRAALASFSPALLADGKDWNHLYYSIGFTPTVRRYIARSIDVTSVFTRLKEIVPAFTPDLEGAAVAHMNLRNEDLHSGATPFDSLSPNWLAKYYQACTVLLAVLGEKLELLVGPEEAAAAVAMVEAAKDESAKAVLKSVEGHKTVWQSKGPDEQATLSQQALAWATRQTGHRVVCPACGNTALVTGSPMAAPLRSLDGDFIVETQQYLPARFECVACQLKISGLSQLHACGLGDPYKSTSTYDAAEYYAPDDELAGYEDDNNEY